MWHTQGNNFKIQCNEETVWVIDKPDIIQMFFLPETWLAMTAEYVQRAQVFMRATACLCDLVEVEEI